MSDSDCTWPATDDFGSRFLEIDEYAVETFEPEPSFDQDDPSSPPEGYNDTADPNYGFSATCTSFERSNELRTNRGLRLRSFIELEIDDEEDDVTASDLYHTRMKRTRIPRSIANKHSNTQPDSEEELCFKGFRSPKVTTARQRSLQMQRAAAAAAQQSERYPVQPTETSPTFLSLESLEPSKPSSTPTPEQLAARQLSIARRRESAKRKVELQKRQTVERLLKINADSDNFSRRGRGRGRGARNLARSASAVSLLSQSANAPIAAPEYDNSANLSRNEDDDASVPDLDVSETLDTAPSAPPVLADQQGSVRSNVDPPLECIRTISSTRLSPVNRVYFPSSSLSSETNVSAGLSWIFTPTAPPVVPKTELCAAGCGQTRRYRCSKTGAPLCSLACYKRNLSNCAIVH